MNNTKPGQVAVALAILLSLAGAFISALLVGEHVRMAAGGEGWSRWSNLLSCPGGGAWSCEEALKSDWAYFPFGKDRAGWRIPTALLGLFFFLAAAAWFLIVGRPSSSRRQYHWFAVLFTMGGAAFAGYLDYVMWKKMPAAALAAFRETGAGAASGGSTTICPFCLATHVLAGLLFIVTLALWPRFRRTVILGERVGDASAQSIAVYVPPPDYPPARAAFAWVLIAAGLCTGAYGIYRYQSARQETRAVMAVAKALEARLKDYDDDYQAVFNNFMNEPVMVIPIEANDSIRGRHDAPHTIVMFTDLQCPHCLNAEKIISEKLAKYPDRLRLVFKHYPLNRDCNPNVQGKTHVAACAAAITVEGARNLAGDEVFWKMYDELFHHQGEFARGALNFVKEACGRIGIENDALWKKIHTLGIDQRIREHTEQARVLGIQSTPAIYFDGRKVAGWVNSKFWDFLMYLDKSGNLPAIPPSMAPPPSTTPAPATTPAGL